MIRSARSTAAKSLRSSMMKRLSTQVSRMSRFSAVQSSRQFSVISGSAVRTRPITRMPQFSRRTYAEVVKVPEMAESINEGTLTGFSKEVGDYVEADEEVASIETDKIDVAVNAPFAGTITKFLANPDDTVEVGQPLFEMDKGGEGAKKESKKEEPKKEESKKEEPKKEESKKDEGPKKDESPAPKKKEEPKKDESPAPKKESKPAKKETKKESAPEESAPVGTFSRHEEAIKMTRMRLRVAERLKESQNTAAFLTTFNEVDMSSVLEMRKLYKDEIIKKTGIKFGFMGLFSRASALALKEVPAVNASIDGQNMVYHDFVDISIAVATPKGLVTPVVRNVESLDVLGVEKEIHRLSLKARDGQITLEDMTGGTFTISNGGVFGSMFGTPIINMPQCAVLGLHGVKDRAVVVNGKVESRPMMYLALTYDHRIVDGREAVIFLRTIKELIEDPRKMLLA